MSDLTISRGDLATLITAVVWDNILPAVIDEAVAKVEARVMATVTEVACLEAADRARTEARAVVRDLMGREFIVAVTPVEH